MVTSVILVSGGLCAAVCLKEDELRRGDGATLGPGRRPALELLV